ARGERSVQGAGRSGSRTDRPGRVLQDGGGGLEAPEDAVGQDPARYDPQDRRRNRVDDAGDDRGRRRARGDGKGADAARVSAEAGSGDARVATYLFTWNPRVYAWRDLRADIRKLRRGGVLRTDWSCARSKRIRAGDRFFLLR